MPKTLSIQIRCAVAHPYNYKRVNPMLYNNNVVGTVGTVTRADGGVDFFYAKEEILLTFHKDLALEVQASPSQGLFYRPKDWISFGTPDDPIKIKNPLISV